MLREQGSLDADQLIQVIVSDKEGECTGKLETEQKHRTEPRSTEETLFQGAARLADDALTGQPWCGLSGAKHESGGL